MGVLHELLAYLEWYLQTCLRAPASGFACLASRLALRREVFFANLARARAHNADPTRSWDMNANEFAAMTWEESACSCGTRVFSGASGIEYSSN